MLHHDKPIPKQKYLMTFISDNNKFHAAEDQQRIHKGVHRGFKNVMPNLLNNNNKNVGK
jgi:hypothetical protein